MASASPRQEAYLWQTRKTRVVIIRPPPCSHGASIPGSRSGPRDRPWFRTSTFVFPTPEAAERAFDITSGRKQLEPGESEYLVYSRFNHPNAEILQDQMVPLEENAEWALAFNSGLAAIMTALLTVLKPGDSIVYTMPLYGGTMGMMHNLLEPYGIHTVAVPAGHSEELDEAIRSTPMLRAVLIETPANPTMVMADIKRAALICGELNPSPC